MDIKNNIDFRNNMNLRNVMDDSDMDFQNSRTYQNLMTALEGESKAHTKYEIYADKAHEEGLEEIAGIFSETAHHEKEHAEIWLKILNRERIPSTLENLRDAASGEEDEWTQMYPEFARIAQEEGYPDIAKLFSEVADIENSHDNRYQQLISNIENEQVFCKTPNTVWVCLNCGYTYRGICAPRTCPVCHYPQGYFAVKKD